MAARSDHAVSPTDRETTARCRVLSDHLAHTSPKLAAAFSDAAPSVAQRVGHEDLRRWAGMGARLGAGGWDNLGLAVRFFETSPALLDLIDLDGLEVLADTLAVLAANPSDLASVYLRDAGDAIGGLPDATRRAFVDLLGVVARRCRSDLDRCLEHTPAMLAPLDDQVRTPLVELARRCVQAEGPGSITLFHDAAETLVAMPQNRQRCLTQEAVALGTTNPGVALEMIRGAAEVLGRLEDDAALRWRCAGRELLTDPGGQERARSWFRLESAGARERLAELAGRVNLADTAPLLRLYAQALSGRELVVQPVGVLAGRGIGWSASGRACTDGTSVYLPGSIDTFDDHEANFAAFKVHTTLQATRLTHGSFDYVQGRDGTYLPATTPPPDTPGTPGTPDTPGTPSTSTTGPGPPQDPNRPQHPDRRRPAMRLFFERFEDQRLIRWLFALAEGTRIAALASHEYPGIAPWLSRLQARAACDRPRLPRPTERQLFAESLVIASLGFADRCPAPLPSTALELIDLLVRPGATVQDAAEAASRLYGLAVMVPNVSPGAAEDRRAAHEDARTDGSEIPFDAPEQPELHGDYKPETVQTMDLLDAPEDPERLALTRDELEDLLRENAELEVEGKPLTGAELEAMLDNFEREAEERARYSAPEVDPGQVGNEVESEVEGSEVEVEGSEVEVAEDPGPEDPGAEDPDAGADISWFRYDEWDFRAHDYLNEHCRVGERPAAEGELGHHHQILAEHHRLVVQTRRRFEQLRPEAFRRINRLEDGSDIDLDEAIAFRVDRVAGTGSLPRFYTRRNKIVRDVAVALLIDQSASTREPAAQESKRVIDVVKDATVVMVEALEATGDAYAIYGFSGQGREDVEVHVVKDLDEALDDRVRQRIAGIEPLGATRMGPAIRHTVARLHAHPAKVKLLILVSDGRPEDEDYGPERGGIDYPLHDTKRALVEAKRRRIEPFLITVDSTGSDYLAQMCGDLGYEVVPDVQSLPGRLLRLYRYLTTE